jgi:hypothetical protein
MLYKKIITLLIYQFIVNSLVLFPNQAQAERVDAGSPLCLNRKLETVIGLSSNQLKAAICTSKNKTYYIAQKKGVFQSLVLPIAKSSVVSNSGLGILYQARNGSYTYQILATCNPFEQHKNWANISIFKQGKKINYQKFNNYFVDSGWCNDAFGQQN